MIRTPIEDFLDVMHFATVDPEWLAESVRDAGTPVDGKLAAAIHRALSSDFLPARLASRTYELLGYVPFHGYPLRRLS